MNTYCPVLGNTSEKKDLFSALIESMALWGDRQQARRQIFHFKLSQLLWGKNERENSDGEKWGRAPSQKKGSEMAT